MPLTSKVPKVMVSVHGKPFLQYLLEYHKKHNIVLSLGYKSGCIVKWCKDNNYVVEFVEEPRPIGVCGAVRFAEEFLIGGGSFAVINGDTFIDEPLDHILDFHIKKRASITYVTAIDKMDNQRKHAGVYIISDRILSSIPWTFQGLDMVINAIKGAKEYKSKNMYLDIGTHESLKYCKSKMFGEVSGENISRKCSA